MNPVADAEWFSRRFSQGSAILRNKSWPTYDGKLLDRNAYLTASEANTCLRKLAYEKRGTEQDKNQTDWTGVQQRGDAVEMFVVDAVFASLDDEKEVMLWFGSDQVSFYDDDLKVSATIDGAILQRDTGMLVLHEVKSVDPRTNIEGWTGPRDKHRYQMVAGANILRKLIENGKLKEQYPELWEATKHGRISVATYSHIIYVDANDLSRHRSFVVANSFSGAMEDTWQAILGRARKLFPGTGVAKPQDMPAEGVLNGDCTFCPFKSKCSEHRKFFDPNNEKQFKSPVVRSAVTLLLRTYGQAYKRLKDAEALIDELKPQLKKMLTEKGETEGAVTFLENDAYRAELVEVAGRKSLDTKAVEAVVGADKMKDLYKVGAPSLRLTFIEKSETAKRDEKGN